VILSVFKNNQVVSEVDLAQEIAGSESSRLSFFIGRADSCHVALDDKMISREHAEVIYDNGTWSIKQVSEFGHLIINGAPLTDKVLATGDMITITPYSINVFIKPIEATPEVVATPEPEVLPEEVESEDEEDDEPSPTETVAISESEVLASAEGNDEGEEEAEEAESSELDEFSDEEESSESDNEFGEEGGFSSEGDESNIFSGENDDVEFPEDNEGTEAFETEGGEDDYGLDDDYGDYDDDGDKTQVLQSFASVQIELFGEYAPYDKINVEMGETFIGRDPEKCQIILTDPEVSSVHAVIRRNNMTCTLEDLQSGNGTLLNGERVNKQMLTNEDEFIIGATTFTVNIGSDFLESEQKTLMPVEENQSVEVEEIVEVGADFEGEIQELEGEGFGEEKAATNSSLFSKESLKDPVKRKKLIYIGAGLVLAFVLLTPDPKPEKKLTPKEKAALAKKAKEKKGKAGAGAKKKLKLKKKFTKEQLEFLDGTYQLAKELFDQGKYDQAIFEMDKIFSLTPEYKNVKQLYDLSKVGLAKIEELERKRQAEIARQTRMKKVKELVEKARVATKEHNVVLAEGLYQKIMELDPENFDVPQFRLELDAWKKEQDRAAVEKAQKEAERKRQVNALAPGKNFYMKEKWHSAVIKLEKFLQTKGLDDDLVKEGSNLLKKAKENLGNVVKPLLGKARSLREGQDLKGAYEHYKEILEYDPTNGEALNEMDDIRQKLNIRSKKIYQEAIISESLNLYNDAKEKFQEVQQVAPSDSDYYRKATDKLQDYLD